MYVLKTEGSTIFRSAPMPISGAPIGIPSSRRVQDTGNPAVSITWFETCYKNGGAGPCPNASKRARQINRGRRETGETRPN